jgi:hypothetical protein
VTNAAAAEKAIDFFRAIGGFDDWWMAIDHEHRQGLQESLAGVLSEYPVPEPSAQGDLRRIRDAWRRNDYIDQEEFEGTVARIVDSLATAEASAQGEAGGTGGWTLRKRCLQAAEWSRCSTLRSCGSRSHGKTTEPQSGIRQTV